MAISPGVAQMNGRGRRSAAPRPIPRHLAVGIGTVGIGTYLAVYVVWLAFQWGGEANRALIGDIFFMLPITLAVVLAWQASRRCAPNPRLLLGRRPTNGR